MVAKSSICNSPIPPNNKYSEDRMYDNKVRSFANFVRSNANISLVLTGTGFVLKNRKSLLASFFIINYNSNYNLYKTSGEAGQDFSAFTSCITQDRKSTRLNSSHVRI